MSKNKILTVCLIAIIMVVLVGAKAFAAENIYDALMNQDPEPIAEGNTENTANQNVAAQNNALVESNNTTENNTAKQNNVPTTTPYTGIGDYSTYIFIGIFAISAIYAYKKVKEYNA